MYKIAMRTGRNGEISYIVQEEFKVFGVTKWKNIKAFNNYDAANTLYKQLSNGRKEVL